MTASFIKFALLTTFTPLFILSTFILFLDSCRGAEFPSSQLLALEDLFVSTNGAGWMWKDETFGAYWNFTNDANPCLDNWQGITCVLQPQDNFYYVSQLNLSQYNLVGQLPNSVEQLPQLTTLDLGGNRLIGPIPRTIGNLSQLKLLNLSFNALSKWLPEQMGDLLKLEVLLLYNNQLSGILPTSFSQLYNLRQLMLQFNAFVGSVEQAFNSSIQSSLIYVSLNNNQITGTLPETLFSNTNLRSIYLDNNCFHGDLTQTVCKNTQLEVLSLGCLHSASQCVLYPFQPISNTFMQSATVHGTLPACMLEIPSLQLLNLAGNALTGAIPNKVRFSPNLTNVNLMYNELVGTLPSSLQRHKLSNLYLSHNYLTGSLISQQTSFPPDQYWNLANNRLSGTVPSAVRTADSINILTGNLFSCMMDKTDLPQNDHGRLNYECGSNSLNMPYVFWSSLIVTSVVLSFGAFYWREKVNYLDVRGWFVNARAWVLCAREVKSPGLKRLRQVAKHITIVACICASALLIFGVPAYAAMTVFYGTYSEQYTWTVAFVLLSGIAPFVFGFIMFVLTIILFTVFYISNNKHTSSAMREKFQMCAETPSLEIVGLCAAYFMIHLTVSLSVNIAYVNAMIRMPATFEFVISLYKMFWNGVCAPHLSRYMFKRLHMTPADLFSLELYVSLMNNVMVPVLAIAFVHPRCFYGAFVRNARFSSYYNDVETLYVFPFRYNFQCSFEYMKYYSAAFIYLAIFTAFGIPAYDLTLLFWYKRATPGTYWYHCVSYMLPRILKPLSADYVRANDSCKPIFDGTKFLVDQLTCLALILSLGVVTPLLGGCLALCMVGTSAYTVLIIGRYLHHVQKSPHAKHYIESIEIDSRGVVNNIMLRKSFWLLFFLSCWFVSPFLFDTLGASVGFERSFWVLIAVPLFPWVVFLLFRTTRNEVVWDYLAENCAGSLTWMVNAESDGTDAPSNEAATSLDVGDEDSLPGVELPNAVHNALLHNRTLQNVNVEVKSDAVGCV